MRPLILLALLAATSASAQAPEPRVPTTGDRVLIVAGAVGGGLLLAPVGGPFAPVGVAVATYGTSAALGFDPTVVGVLLQSMTGTLVGVGTTYVVYGLATGVGGADGDLSTAVGALLAGFLVGAATTGVLHGRDLAARADGGAVSVVPAALAAPTGERTMGLSLRVGL